MNNERSALLLGNEALEILKNKTVLVIGIGGVGSFCVEALARTGIGHLILVDKDKVESSNINRQLLATTALFESFSQKSVKSRSGRHRQLKNNPKITHGILCRYYM